MYLVLTTPFPSRLIHESYQFLTQKKFKMRKSASLGDVEPVSTRSSDSSKGGWKSSSRKIGSVNQFISLLGSEGAESSEVVENMNESLGQWYLDTLDEVQWQEKKTTGELI